MQRKWSEEQIIGLLKQNEAGVPAAQLCREHGVSESSFYKWKSKYGGLEVSEAKRLKTLEDENSKLKRLLAQNSNACWRKTQTLAGAKLKRLLADAMLDNAALKDVLSKNW